VPVVGQNAALDQANAPERTGSRSASESTTGMPADYD
jgi:hypothetical protein